MTPAVQRLTDRLRRTPILHLADQVLSSGTNFLAVVVVARLATPTEFGLFSLLLVTYFVTAGFNRSVPHAVAMTLEWDDERSRSGYFFLPAMAIGMVGTVSLLATFAILDRRWMAASFLLLPLLLQDAVRMHAFAIRKPQIALLSDGVWLAVEVIGFIFVTTVSGAATIWGLAALCALLAARPWRLRLRVQRRPIGATIASAALEYGCFTGLGYLTPVLASPVITLVGVGALQGSNVIRGPILLLVQGLIVHRMSGPPITPTAGVREALHLASATLLLTLICLPPLFLLRNIYGPRLLGSTWSEVEPLVLPALLTLIPGSVAFAPATVVRKMGRFVLSAKVQAVMAPMFVALPLLGAVVAGTSGFLYATAGAYVVFGVVWWIMLSRIATTPAEQAAPLTV